MDVEFHDAAIRPFHFTDYNKFTLAALGSVGAAFASRSTASLASTIYYRPFDNWASKNDWSIQLPEGENALSIACNTDTVIVSTDQQYVRFLSTGGIQTGIRSFGGPIISLAANDHYILIAYHQSGVFHGNQNIAYNLIKDNKTVASGTLPISPNSTLTWLGFSNEGVYYY
jgi:chromosome transmission fidelity protein 4